MEATSHKYCLYSTKCLLKNRKKTYFSNWEGNNFKNSNSLKHKGDRAWDNKKMHLCYILTANALR